MNPLIRIRPPRAFHAASLAVLGLLTVPAPAQTFDTFGAGCGGASGVPALGASGCHRVGQTTVFAVTNAPPGAGALLFGLVNPNLDLRPGMPGCRLYSSGDIPLPIRIGASGAGSASVRWPNQTALIGATAYAQVFVPDLTAGRPIPLSATNGGVIVLGSPVGKQWGVSLPMSVTVPAMPALGVPSIRLGTTLTGSRTVVCCATNPVACQVSASGRLQGSTGSFRVPLPASSVIQAINTYLCGAIRSVSGGTVSCSTSLDVTVGAVRIDQGVTLGHDGCTNAVSYSGTGSVVFQNVRGSGRVTGTIDLPLLPKFSFGFDLTVTANAAGNVRIANDALAVDLGISSIRVQASYTIPVINKRLTFGHTLSTPSLKAGVPGVPLPNVALGLTCR